MAAGIQQYDIGVFFSNNPLWHRNPAYRVINRPVNIDEVREVFNWEIEKKQLSYLNDKNENVLVNAFSLIRKDTQHILVDSVGSKFEAASNLQMVDIIENGVLKAFPDLILEGAATLWGNKTAFIQLKAKEFQIKGDKSPTFCRLTYLNPLGNGSYKALVHNERVVCANTLRIASSEGKANRSLKKFSHLRGAFLKLDNYMQELAEQWLMIEKHNVVLESLTKSQVDTGQLNTFLKFVYPQTANMSDVAIGHINEHRQAVITQFNKDQDLTSDVAFSKYGLLQALTYVVDHETFRKDPIKTYYDNIAGARMDTKADAFDWLAKAA